MIKSEIGMKIEEFIDKKYSFDSVQKADQKDIITEILCSDKKSTSYGYRFGVKVGGPIYIGYINWIKSKITTNSKLIFLSTDCKVLYEAFCKLGFTNTVLMDVDSSDEADDTYITMRKRLEKEGYRDSDCYLIDWGNGADIQYNLNKVDGAFTKTVNYFAIDNSKEAIEHVYGLHYEAYAFDFYKNFGLQENCKATKTIMMQLIGDANAKIVEGIIDYVLAADKLSEYMDFSYTPEYVLDSLIYMVNKPSEEDIRYFKELNNIYQGNKKTNERGYHLEDDRNILRYHRWIKKQSDKSLEKEKLSYEPKFSVVVPVYNTATEQLREAIESVIKQNYINYELILIEDCSTWDNVRPVLAEYEKLDKVIVIYRSENGNISAATNDGIERANGEFIVFMDCDDILEEDALYSIACKLNENQELDFIYSDEDKITEDGKILHMPFFKPEWSPEYALNINYVTHLTVYRTELVRSVGGLRSEYNGSQDYDLLLRCMDKLDAQRVGHVAKVLYHWRERKESVSYSISAKNYAIEAAYRAKIDYLKRNDIKAKLEYEPVFCQYRVIYDVIGNPLVSIIIPSKDNPDTLKRCIDSIYEFSTYKNIEVIVVDNGSAIDNKAVIEEYLAKREIQYIYSPMEFNFSRMCNIGADISHGEFLLFLNDDIEIFQADWLERMIGQAQQPGIGAVGAKLYYPKTTLIQHMGVYNAKQGPAHILNMVDDAHTYAMGINRCTLNCIAVTGACLLVPSKVYYEVGGFDDSLPVAYNDVALCMSMYTVGYRIVQRNDVVAYHYESYSRGDDTLSEEKLLRLSKERIRLYNRFGSIAKRDPYINRHLNSYSEVLDMVDRFDAVETVELGDRGNILADVEIYIDRITISDGMQIEGWSFCKQQLEEGAQRYLLFMDPLGDIYRAEVNAMWRPDVVDAFAGNKDYLYCGFDCLVDRNIIRGDILRYKIGIQVIDKDGKVYVAWADKKTDLVRTREKRTEYCQVNSVNNEIKCTGVNNVIWAMDENSMEEEGILIRGYAFISAKDHFKYKTLIYLRDKDANILSIEPMLNERLDIAAAYPEIPFLYDKGFVCRVLKDSLSSETNYDIIIHVEEVLDCQNSIDIVTGHMVCLV